VVASLCVPVVTDGQVAGLLHIDNRSARPFSERDETILGRLADHAAIANARLYREAREVRDQLVQAQKMEAIGRLAGGVAHDFNNLLTVILGRAEAMRHAAPTPDLARSAELIEHTARRAADLTQQLLAFSRRQVLHLCCLDLSTVVSDLDTILRRLLPEDIEFHASLATDLPQIKADPGQLEQIVMNLVLNARDAMPRGGRLTLTTATVDWTPVALDRPATIPPGQWVTLTVHDTGVGMDAETLARIFEPFYTTKDNGKGTGLGLATVYGIVQQSGGHIGVTSRPGGGTTFIVAFPPAAETGPVAVRAAPAITIDRGSETILLLEDNENVRETVADILTGPRLYCADRRGP
jgi:signal transduction histidine kinase